MTIRLRDLLSLPDEAFEAARSQWLAGQGMPPAAPVVHAAEPGKSQYAPRVSAHWREAMASFPARFQAFHPGLEPVVPAVRGFVEAVLLGAGPRWLSLLGPYGVGKTLVLRETVRFLERHWLRVSLGSRGYRSPTIAHLKPEEDLGDWRAPQAYARHDLLYIEDIGSGRGLADRGAAAVMRDRIAELLQARTGKWTLLCANLSRKEIADHIDPRIASRLRRDDSTCIEIPWTVPDWNG